MTTISFHYDQDTGFDHALKITTVDGAEIKVCFDGLEATYIYINGEEFPVDSDYYKGLYVNLGHGLETDIMPLSYVVTEANNQIEDIVDEGEQADRAWQRHVNSFSQPY